MKKMFYMLALIVSSFFFFSSNVNAEEYSYTYPFTSNISATLDDNFYDLRSRVKQYIKDNNYDYYIIYKGVASSIGTKVYIFTDDSNISCTTYTNSLFLITSVYYRVPTLLVSSDLENLTFVEDTATHTFQDTQNAIVLDTNYPFTLSSPDTWTYNHRNNSLSFSTGDRVPNLYTFYTTYYGIEDDTEEPEPVIDHTHDSELSIIQSFYEVSISKISYLAESISSNYVYLSIFGVFILIFVFELIFRRYL